MRQKRVALYARVSTSDKGQDTEVQLRELREYTKLRDFGEVTEYIDAGFSGAHTKRPALQKLLIDAKIRKFDVVITQRLDRLGRSLIQLITMIHDLGEIGVSFIFLKEAIDMTTSQGRLMLGLFGTLAEYEREIIRSRVLSGLANARAKGKRLGAKKLRNDDQIAKLRKEGLSIKAIAKIIGMSKKTVQNSLRGDMSPSGTAL